jgi:hypothetical protein
VGHRVFTVFHHRRLVLLAALHHDALYAGPAHPLWRAIVREPHDRAAVTSRGR